MWIKAVSVAAIAGMGAAMSAVAGPLAPVDGAQTFRTHCAACHSVEAGKNGIGPSLFKITSRRAGTQPGYAYSPALKASGIAWNPEDLDRFLAAPEKAVPGTKMLMVVREAEQRKALVVYLRRL
jgi:cytochrome c